MDTSGIGRRDFLKATLLAAGCHFVTAGLPFAASQVEAARTRKGLYLFPHGVASADPLPDSVVLWTRVEAKNGATDPIDLMLEVSTDTKFKSLVLQKEVRATSDSDHTVRVIVDGLESDTRYFYRFRAGADKTALLGQTRTAPDPSSERPIRFAFISCQNYEQGFYGAWRRLLNDDESKPDTDQIEFVLNLGDFIYESLAFYGEKAEREGPGGPLVGRDGRKRVIPPFPEGTATRPGGRPYAESLNDYRHLYKSYLTDPDLQAARARWAFISTWDDHEFTNDSWQSQSTYTHEGIPSQQRKVAANQAWFEYIPSMLSRGQGDDDATNPARDFVFVEVENTTTDGAYEADPNNKAALGSMTIYRSLRFGKHVDLIVTDSRSYRSDHAIPEPLAMQIGPRARAFMPVKLVEAFDGGRDYNGGNPPDVINMGANKVNNVRKDQAPGTVLGADQKNWWKNKMAQSTATWKIWANSIPCLPLRLDFDDLTEEGLRTILSTDAWDGYPSERSDLMKYLLDNGIDNVISLSGDHHMHFAGVVMDDFEADTPRPVMPEFSIAGISSTSTYQSIVNVPMLPRQFRDMTFFDVVRDNGDKQRIEAFNLTLLQGMRASLTGAKTKDPEKAKSVRNPSQNPHLRYMDSNSNGYGIITVRADGATVQMMTIENVSIDAGKKGPALRRTANFEVSNYKVAKGAQLDDPGFEGIPPYPFD